MGECNGLADDHCCYIHGVQCQYLVENQAGRRWACSLKIKYNDWDSVLASDEYRQDVAPKLKPMGINCRDWPGPGNHCGTCGYGVADGNH